MSSPLALMTDQIKIIQDISLLFELSLTVGSTLDPEANCHDFLRTMISRKSLKFGSIWLYKNGNGPESHCDLFYIHPHFRQKIDSFTCSPFLLQALETKPYFSISSQHEHYDDFLHENKVEEGSYAIFGLGELGFLKLFATNRPAGFDEVEMAQLMQVVEKLKVSLIAGFGRIQLIKETENRLSAQKALEENEQHLRRMIDSSMDAVISANEAGLVLEWNTQAEIMFGYSRKEVLGKHIRDLFIPKRHWAQFQAVFETFLNSSGDSSINQRYEVKCIRKSGAEFPAELSASVNKMNNNLLFVGFVRDITEQRRAEQAIRESEEKYRGVLENMELGLLEVDLEERIIRANNAFCQMIGFTQEELVGQKTVDMLFLPEASKQHILGRLEERKQGVSSVYELQFMKKDGSLIWLLISGAPLRNSSGQIIGSIGIHFDLTERKNLETALEKAKMVADRARMAERQFLANMSHEIRTPINAVIGMTHLLDETEPNQDQKEYLNSLRFSADSLLGIVDNILDLSKIDAGEIEFEYRLFDLGYLLKALIQTFQFKVKEKDLQITETMDPAIENLVGGDPFRINQILTNLLGNAVKFTEKGVISLHTKLLEKTDDQYLLEFRVHDTGMGIASDKMDIIFEYFKQADVEISQKFGGTGLGLAIVKQLVEMQGGSIHVESELGIGSDFVVRLGFGNSGMAASVAKELPERDQYEPLNPIQGLHFLIVEDNLMNQKLLCKTIQLWKGTFQVANNGMEALEKSAKERFDLILMDIHMPVLNGFETTLAIRNDEKNPNRDVSILALTAAALSVDKRRAFEAGMNGFLTKPIAPKALKEHILSSVPRRPTQALVISAEAENPLDLSYLMNLSNGDQVFVQEIIDVFLADTPLSLRQLEMDVKNQDWEGCYKVVHKLKPNFAMFGMKNLELQASTLETILKSKSIDPDKIVIDLTQLRARTFETFPLLIELKKELVA
ncbi:MAG: PAS domain S-box protein [Saprospiraceae bacterium]